MNDPVPPRRATGPVPGARRRVSLDHLVHVAPLSADTRLPLVISPALAGLDLRGWAAGRRATVDAWLCEHGAVLCRGFDPGGVAGFAELVRELAGDALEYRERSSPRSRVGDKVYTSTDYPADQQIAMHNENSYQQTWPLRLFFLCDTPAAQGGETPIADCRQVYAAIDPDVRERFARVGWMYVRNFSERLGLSWQKVFQTDDPAAVEAYCREHDIETQWLEHGRLRTRARRPAILRHPHTGEWLWFNHAAFFHITTLPALIREPLLAEFSAEELPANSFYGDGLPIEPEVVAHVRRAYEQATVEFPWQRGDVLLLDNMLVAHGRRPYSGARRILVSMSEPCHARDCAGQAG